MAEPPTPQPRGRVARFIERARRPNRAHVDKLKDRVPFWFVALVLFAFALLQILLNPFGFSDLTQRYTQDVSNLLITGPYLYPETGREQVTVALVDEPTLHHLQMPWPWRYSEHARALDAIRAYKPKAVVVDFLFVDNRPDESIQELVDEIGRYRQDGIPIYFEGGTKLPYGEVPLRREIAGTGVPIVDPTIDVYDGVVRQYPASGLCFGPSGETGTGCPSLAVRVFKDLYPRIPLAPLPGKIELVWGTRTAPTNEKLNLDEKGNPQPCYDPAGFLLRTYRAFFDKHTALAHCPYSAWVPLEGLLMGLDDKDQARLIPGHIVIYGGSLAGAQDTSYMPVNGLQANVFVHAMALDNLITFGGKPEQNVMTVLGMTIGNEPAQILAIIPIILVLSWLHLRRIRSRHRRAAEAEHGALYDWFAERLGEHFWYWFGYLLALAVGLLLALSVGLSVANWVEDVFVSAELGVMLLIGLPDSFWGYLHHVAGGGDKLQEVST